MCPIADTIYHVCSLSPQCCRLEIIAPAPRMYFKNVVKKKMQGICNFSGNMIFHEGNLKDKVTEFQANRHQDC